MTNSYIAGFFVESPSDTWYQYGLWWQVRSKIYEVMFFIAVLFPLFKRTPLAVGLTWAAAVLVGCSAIDKVLLSVFDYHVHDIIVGAAAMYAFLTKQNEERRKTS